MTKRKKKTVNGDGGIRRRPDGLWEARYCVVIDGIAHRRSVYGRTRDEIGRKLRVALKARDDGMPLPMTRETVGEFLARWIDGAAPSLRPPSVRRYRNVLDGYIIPAIGNRRLRDLQPYEVQVLYSSLIARGLSPATVRLVHFVLHRALDQAARWGLVVRNVTDLVDIPRIPRAEAPVLTVDQVRVVLELARDDPFEALFVVALTAGLRRGELLALRWIDVDLDLHVVDVRGTMQPDGVIAEPKSRSSRRRVPLGVLAVDALRRHRAAQIERGCGIGWSDEGYVFATDTGVPLPPMTLLRHWYDLLAGAGISRVPFHTTRHSAATLMVSAGVSPKVAAERLGHATAALTLDRYSHITEALRHDAADAIDAVLAGPADTAAERS